MNENTPLHVISKYTRPVCWIFDWPALVRSIPPQAPPLTGWRRRSTSLSGFRKCAQGRIDPGAHRNSSGSYLPTGGGQWNRWLGSRNFGGKASPPSPRPSLAMNPIMMYILSGEFTRGVVWFPALPGNFTRTFSMDIRNDVQILAPLHRGIGGIGNLNDQIRDAINPTGATQVMGPFLFREGDKVIQTRNNYDKDVFNGDMGIVDSVDTLNGKVEIRFDDRIVSYERMEVTDLQPAYAISVHKSQGREYPVVIFPLLKQHFMMLQRNLVYTGLTRAKKK